MLPYKAVIIEDEPKSAELLKTLLNMYCPEISVEGVAGNINEAYALIIQAEPALVFLDIELPGGSGFRLLEMFSRVNFSVIFTTSYDQYAIQAIQVSALDYILKPIHLDSLRAAIKRFLDKQAVSTSARDVSPVHTPKAEHRHSLFHLPTVNGFILVNQEEIVRLQAEGPYTHLILHKPAGRKTCSMNLGEVEKKLNPDLFFRVHKSHIIQKQYITEYQRGDGGTALMSDGAQIPVSRAAKEGFLLWLE